MRTLVLCLLIISLTLTFGRPMPVESADDNDVEEVEYDNEPETTGTDDDAEDDEELRRTNESNVEEQEEPIQNQRLREENKNSCLQRPAERLSAKVNGDYLPSYKVEGNNRLEEEMVKPNYKSPYETPVDRESSRLTDLRHKVEESDPDKNFFVSDSLKNIGNKKKYVHTVPNEEVLFDNQEVNKVQSNKFSRHAENDQARFSKKNYHSVDQGVANDRYDNRIYLNRDRRAAQENTTNGDHKKLNDELKNLNTEDEETAIKRHVKQLSTEELKELMNSLSEDKRQLLKKIMESDTIDSNNFKKREITKKNGATLDENSYSLESERSDFSKLQDPAGDVMTSGAPQNINQTQFQTDMTALPARNLGDNNESSEIKADIVSDIKSSNYGNTIGPVTSNQEKITANVQEQSKNNNKREINSDECSNIEAFDEEESKFFDNDFNIRDSQELSNEFTDDESQLNKNGNTLKREANDYKESELSESMKSLEESFPNSNSYDENDPYLGSDMAPLIRVKRKNNELLSVKKRAAGILPDAKVAFFPYRSENDEEENEEGNEFDDEGFYDRSANIVKNYVEEDPSNREEIRSKLSAKNEQKSIINTVKIPESNNVEKDKMSVGSDTDSVLSGVEGVDDTLMLNTGSRIKRTVAEDAKEDSNLQINSNRAMRSPLSDEVKKKSENNVLRYDESEAFGSLPRSYEGGLGRYKRIRRIKQPTASDSDIAPTNT